MQQQQPQILNHEGDQWRVIGIGATNDKGKTYVHLASMTRSRQQKNGCCPIQMGDWIDSALITVAPANMPELVKHITTRGRVISGIICDWLTYEQVEQIDPYTFKKDGGWFIREKHIESMGLMYRMGALS